MDIVEAINQCDRPPFDTIHFDDNQIQELSLASWLHDVGKIITPQHIIDKHAKLETVIDRAELIRTRFQVIESSLRLENAQAKIDGLIRNETGQAIQHLDTQLDAAIKELHAELELILSCNRSLEFMPPTRLEQIRAIGRKTYIWQGRKYPYLSENEMDNLCIQKGNLSEKDRKIVEDHARATWDMLSQLPFPKHLANVATYAAQHHEKLNGSGYSQGLTEKDLPLQSRILAIADIFEALTAADRPYKDPMPISRALEIMGLMKKDGQLDPDVLDLFINNKVFMKYVTNEVDPSLNDIT
jgi:response regulator RpfG family c-di-GMP phosphodiesterase